MTRTKFRFEISSREERIKKAKPHIYLVTANDEQTAEAKALDLWFENAPNGCYTA